MEDVRDFSNRTGVTRRLGRWRLIFDRQYREAERRRKLIQAGKLNLETVDYTDDGFAIVVPAGSAGDWYGMPAEVRKEFMRAIDNDRRAEGVEVTGWSEFVEGPDAS